MKRSLKYLMIGTCLLLFTIFNLEANAVYYAQNSRVVKKEAVPFILLDHLWWYLDAENVTAGDYFYEVKGHPKIIYGNNKHRFKFYQHVGIDSRFALIKIDNGQGKKYYLFDEQFQLVAIEHYSTFARLPITKEEETYAKAILQKVSKDLLDKTTAPLINLQLVYDLLHIIK